MKTSQIKRIVNKTIKTLADKGVWNPQTSCRHSYGNITIELEPVPNLHNKVSYRVSGKGIGEWIGYHST